MTLHQPKGRLLKTFFTKSEWKYLKTVPKFNELLSDARNDLDAVERLSMIGDGLILQEEERKPGCPRIMR